MKILIVSDTHGKQNNLKLVLEREKHINLLIHLGDVEGCEEEIIRMADCPVAMVAGNNDFFCDLPREKELQLGKYRILITHGHYYFVSCGYSHIRREAASRGVDIVMFGHTHYPLVDDKEEVTVLNPGSISYPRQPGRQPSYMIMEIDEKGEVGYQIKYV